MSEPNPKESSALEKSALFFAWVFVGLGFVAAFYGIYVTSNSGGVTLGNLSNFGSFAQGAVASIWSLAGLLFIFVAFLSQKKQLAQQEREFELQTVQFKLQQESIQLQSFETSFFQLLQMLTQIISDLKDAKLETFGPSPSFAGRDCFAYWYDLLRNDFTANRLGQIAGATSAENVARETIVKVYCEEFFQKKQAVFSHYFRILYHLIKFVDASPALKTNEDKRRYVSMVRAQLSAYELVLLFYHGICPMALKFRPLIEKYGLLEHLDKKLLLNEAHKSFYERAYK